ncbi:MAG: DsbA family protein [Hyphomicrobiaceae bacterium]
MRKLIARATPIQTDRRQLMKGLTAVGFSGSISSIAYAQSNDEVPIEKLMAPDELEELSLGSKDAKVTIVEYASMSCPACARFHATTFPELKKKYIETGKVFFVMREFPLNKLAAAGSMLARCAGSPEKSIAMIDVLFRKQRDWVSRDAVAELLKIAKQAGFTEETFNACLKDEALLGKLTRRRDRADAEFGVDATPSFFVNGKRMRTRNFTIEAFDRVLEPLLKNS